MYDRITLFHTDSIERLTLAEIAAEAERRGFKTKFSENLSEPSEIGVYCSHNSDPSHARFSVIMLHDLGQRHDLWPHFWKAEPWTKFDVGLVPGSTWSDRWLAHKRINRWLAPRLGIYEVGWPKADPCFVEDGAFARELRDLRSSMGLDNGKRTVLYAPSWENDGKQDELVTAALALDCNIVIKQADWPLTTHAHVAREIDRLEAKYRDHPRVKTLHRRQSIMYALALADVLVSEESSVIVEALLFGVPAIAVSDWLIPDQNPSRHACVPFDFVHKTVKAQLSGTIEDVLRAGHRVHYFGRELDLKEYSDLWFSRRGGSASEILDLLQAHLEGRTPVLPNICERPGYDGPPEAFPQSLVSRALARLGHRADLGSWKRRVHRKIRALAHD